MFAGNGLKKWKGVALSPDNERKMIPVVQPKPKEVDIAQKENVKPGPPQEIVNNEPTVCNLTFKISTQLYEYVN